MNTNPTAKPSKKPGALGQFFSFAIPLDINNSGLDLALNRITPDANEPLNIVLDLGAATGHIVKPWFKDFASILLEAKVETTIVVPNTSDKDNAENLFDWGTAMYEQVDKWVVVLNQRIRPQFPYYYESPAGMAFREIVKPLEITLERRNTHTEELLKAKYLSNLTAVRLWKERTPAAFERLGELGSWSNYGHIDAAHRQIQEQLDKISEALATSEGKHRMVLVASGIGGVGKSTVARSIVDYYMDDGIVPIVFDGETETR